jgi:hypothetical protein
LEKVEGDKRTSLRYNHMEELYESPMFHIETKRREEEEEER